MTDLATRTVLKHKETQSLIFIKSWQLTNYTFLDIYIRTYKKLGK